MFVYMEREDDHTDFVIHKLLEQSEAEGDSTLDLLVKHKMQLKESQSFMFLAERMIVEKDEYTRGDNMNSRSGNSISRKLPDSGIAGSKRVRNSSFFLGGVSKKEILDKFGAHIFFDDQHTHTDPAAEVVPSAFVPYRDGDDPTK